VLRPLAPIAAALVAVAGLAACGGDSDDKQVRAVVERFADAGAKQDYQRICDELITPALSKKVEEIGLPCEVAFRQGLKDVKNPTLTVRSVKIDGDKALVGVHSTAANQQPSDDTVEVVKIDGEWRISSLVGGGGGTSTSTTPTTTTPTTTTPPTTTQGRQPSQTTTVPVPSG
jgi:hypothetical protein